MFRIFAVFLLLTAATTATFPETSSVEKATPTEINDGVRVTSEYANVTRVTQEASTVTKWTITTKAPNARLTWYIATDEISAFEETSDVKLNVNGRKVNYTTESHLQRTWVTFETTQDDPTITFSPAALGGSGSFSTLEVWRFSFLSNPATILIGIILLLLGLFGSVIAYRNYRDDDVTHQN